MTIKEKLEYFNLPESPWYIRAALTFLAYLLLFVTSAALLISVNTLFGTTVPINFWTVLSGVLLIDFVENLAELIGGSSNYVTDTE